MRTVSLSLFIIGTILFTGCSTTQDVRQVKAAYQTNNVISHPTYHSANRASSSIVSMTSTKQREFLEAINTARSKPQNCGVYGVMRPARKLKWNDKLYQAAYGHSYDMAKNSHFSHEGSGTLSDQTATQMSLHRGSSLGERIRFHNYNWQATAENIGSGQSSTEEVMRAWLASDGHCKNLMNEMFTEVGMAFYKRSDGKGYYWTQNFGNSF